MKLSWMLLGMVAQFTYTTVVLLYFFMPVSPNPKFDKRRTYERWILEDDPNQHIAVVSYNHYGQRYEYIVFTNWRGAIAVQPLMPLPVFDWKEHLREQRAEHERANQAAGSGAGGSAGTP